MALQDQLTSAAARGDATEVEHLLRLGVDVNGVNSFGRTALQVMMMGSTQVARVLLDQGAEPNVPDRSTGRTPLHDAAQAGFVESVRLLVQSGADAQARDHRNQRPVDLATSEGHSDIVEFLETLTTERNHAALE
ncbi:cyclin-dependent kinase 4 inhibitor B [Synchiropus splendidus]|uniref:cyclin-dependent kinase 4 inhibitor B n=1 Tax=Synchiropus splendidus TaxID=270530 RepID=UPI00237D4650|nr:cyclin-dependent kinase 4 inhibitor B [Synchiropus splendidus]